MIYITGDTHGEIGIGKLSSKKFPEGRQLTKKDYVIVTGDFGLIWDVNESREREKYWINWLTNKRWTTLFLDGNHENFDRLFALPEVEMFNGKVGKLNNSIFHLKRGEIYKIEDNSIFVFGGAASIDKSRRTDRVSWWQEEIPSYTEMLYGLENLQKQNNQVDYILTHTGPEDVIGDISSISKDKMKDPTTDFLKAINKTASFKKWYFGHFHVDTTLFQKYVCQYYSIVKLGETNEKTANSNTSNIFRAQFT